MKNGTNSLVNFNSKAASDYDLWLRLMFDHKLKFTTTKDFFTLYRVYRKPVAESLH